MVKRFSPTKQPNFAPCKGIRIPGNFCLWNLKSWSLEFGIQLKESGISLTIGIQNPSFTDKDHGIRNLEFVIRGVESRIQDCIEFPFMGRQFCFFNLTYYISNKKELDLTANTAQLTGPENVPGICEMTP